MLCGGYQDPDIPLRSLLSSRMEMHSVVSRNPTPKIHRSQREANQIDVLQICRAMDYSSDTSLITSLSILGGLHRVG